jgi:hypothetical protein
VGLIGRRALYGWWVAAVIVFTVLVRLDVLAGPLLADDWDHYAMHAGIYPRARAPLDRFRFVSADAEDRKALLESGRLPWWTDRDIHLAVFRPLSSALTVLDFGVLNGAHVPAILHLHSIVWWTVLIVGVAGLFRQLFPPLAAAIAVLLYALSNCHGVPLAWIANRSEIVAIALVVWGLRAHVAWRSGGSRWGRPIALLLVALGLLAGEHALGPLAYFVAFEATRIEPIRKRVSALLPIAGLITIYLALRSLLGYGVAGSSFYIDPFSDPRRYFSTLLPRMALLFGDLVFGWSAESALGGPPWLGNLRDLKALPEHWLALSSVRPLQLVFGVLAMLLVLLALIRSQRASGRWQTVHWLLLGAVGSLAPVSGVMPMSRLTMAAAIGVDATFAWMLWELVRTLPSWLRHARVRAAGAGLAVALVCLLHIVFASSRARTEARYYAIRAYSEELWVLRAELPATELEHKHVIIISAPDWTAQFGLPFVRHLHGLEMPASSEVLSAASNSRHEVSRIGTNILDLRLQHVHADPAFLNSVYRHGSSGFRVGDFLPCARFEVRVLATEEGEPTWLRFEFPVSVDDSRYVFLYSAPQGLIRMTPPSLGTTVHLPAPTWPRPLPADPPSLPP